MIKIILAICIIWYALTLLKDKYMVSFRPLSIHHIFLMRYKWFKDTNYKQFTTICAYTCMYKLYCILIYVFISNRTIPKISKSLYEVFTTFILIINGVRFFGVLIPEFQLEYSTIKTDINLWLLLERLFNSKIFLTNCFCCSKMY